MVALGLRSLLRKLASPAESLDFQRTAQQCELSQVGSAFEELVHFGYLYVLDPSASDAEHVMMRFHVAVIARNVVEEGYLARLSDFAKLLEDAMNCGQRYVGMPATDCRANLVGAWMVLRGEQDPYNCEPLGCDGYPALMAPRDELAETLN